MSDELLSQEAMDDLLKQGTEAAEKAERSKKKKNRDADAAAPAAEEELEKEEPSEGDTPATGSDPEDIRLYPGADQQVRPVQFTQLTPDPAEHTHSPLDLILDVELQVTVELGRTSMQVRDILELCPGSVVELQKLAGEPVELIVNNKLVARGEVVVIDENFGIRVTEIVSQAERVNSLR